MSSAPTHWALVISVDFAHREILNQSIRKFHLRRMKIHDDHSISLCLSSMLFKPCAFKILGYRTFGVVPSLARQCNCWLSPHWFVCWIVSWGAGPKFAMAKFVFWMLQVHVYQDAFAINFFGTQRGYKEKIGGNCLDICFLFNVVKTLVYCVCCFWKFKCSNISYCVFSIVWSNCLILLHLCLDVLKQKDDRQHVSRCNIMHWLTETNKHTVFHSDHCVHKFQTECNAANLSQPIL